MDKIPIGGMKLSRERLQFVTAEPATSHRPPFAFFGRLAEKKINLPMVCLAGGADEIQSLFCIQAKEALGAKDALDEILGSAPFVRATARVATVTLFPHRFQPAVLAAAVHALDKAGISFSGICTSISAVFINIDFSCLNAAVQALVSVFELPENHTPFHAWETPASLHPRLAGTMPAPGGRITPETVAKYWEPEIKTYGIQTETGLAVLGVSVGRPGGLAPWMDLICEQKAELKMAVILPKDTDTWAARFLLENSTARFFREKMARALKNHGPDRMEIEASQALIKFSGPHFQDRYGIAEAAFGGLAGRKMRINASCAGSSVFLSVPEKSAVEAVRMLSEKFVGPPDPPKNRRKKHESQN